MLSNHRLTIFAAVVVSLAGLSRPLAAKKAEKPDKDLSEAVEAEHAGDFEKALDLIGRALAKKPGEMTYQIASYRIHFECGAMLVHRAVKLRNTGDLQGALQMFQKAYEIDPSSDQAKEEINRTKKMIQRYEKGDTSLVAPTPAEKREEEKTLTPAEVEKKREAEKIASILGVPELKALNPDPINLKMTNQKPRVLFDTVGKLAGINVIFDPDYETTNTIKQTSIDLTNASLGEALDDVAIVTKSFWKVLTPNTIFVTQDSRQKRQEYEEQVVKVFYLQNVGVQAELNEAVTVLRTVADIQKVFTSTPLNAIVIRASADKIPLAEKLIAAIDKPKSEVIIDVMVMEVNRTYMRNLAAAVGVGGINSSINFTPRTALQGVQNTSSSSTTATTGTTTSTTGTTGSSTSTNNTILLSNISHISTADWTVANVPGGLIEALLSDASTKVLQAPQIRALDNFKASLKIGEKIPTATGSFQPGVGGVGVNPLVNTQFTYLDVGVNVDVTPRVNSATDVSSHVAVEVSQEDSTVSIGGIDQPVIGQKRVEMDLRMKDGEINIIGGLIDDETTKSISGVPGLANIPLVGNLFKSTNLSKTQQELLIVMVPHIIRSPDITDEDLKAVATGNETTYKLNYAAAKTAPVEKVPVAAAVPGPPPATAPMMPTPTMNPAAPPPPPAPPVAASFVATPAEVPAGGTVTANVQLNNVTDLSAVQIALKFDPKILRINNIIGGELIRRNGPELVPSRNVLNDAGTATIGIARSPASGGISGSGTVLTIVFQTVGRGPTTVTVPQFTLTGAGGQPIPAPPPTLSINVK
jgi:general secretion pathway protein D